MIHITRHDLGRILDLEGNEVTCPECGEIAEAAA